MVELRLDDRCVGRHRGGSFVDGVQLGAEVFDHRGEGIERRDGAEHVAVGSNDQRCYAVLVEPCREAPVEILEVLKREDLYSDPLQEAALVRPTGPGASG